MLYYIVTEIHSWLLKEECNGRIWKGNEEWRKLIERDLG